ncbi:hypothetical protein I601_0235 [Nocardioides dokdonensis FR1436]|uniref:Peptidase C39 domain-containing protein n=1 Tax=Nocardioides dokdonensis FR1436 TaxID=1300347 RepID=A0A1A9GEJ9_9ACTN|nr:hypothetical protein [Nocardioides dokdonensis]ANH36688.1 hypothetical protein I601_0235 [Nocardioides dokdonensis FR1436]
MPERPWLGWPHRQPDQRSCGAACLVLATMRTDPSYDARLRGDPGLWPAEVQRTHREVTRLRDAGRFALPWPRLLGTPPWAVARRLGHRPGGRWRTRPLRVGRRPFAFDALLVLARHDVPLPVYVGSVLLPRHVVLVVGITGASEDELLVWDPARGGTLTVTRAAFDAGRLPFGRWRTPWFVVLPAGLAG